MNWPNKITEISIKILQKRKMAHWFRKSMRFKIFFNDFDAEATHVKSQCTTNDLILDLAFVCKSQNRHSLWGFPVFCEEEGLEAFTGHRKH